MTSFDAHLEHYRSQHRTLGCKLTHLVGVPLIALSVPMLFFSWRKASTLFCLGWFFQFVGHYVFEGNKPVLLSREGGLNTLISAFIYIGDGWARLFTGRPLVDPEPQPAPETEDDVPPVPFKPRPRRRARTSTSTKSGYRRQRKYRAN